jgi:hypothetical protein
MIVKGVLPLYFIETIQYFTELAARKYICQIFSLMTHIYQHYQKFPVQNYIRSIHKEITKETSKF